MPSVLNKYHFPKGIPSSAVYIGRPSVYGNPFEIGKDGTRDEVVEKYRQWISTQPELIQRIKRCLHGKDLVCYCAPKRCHGDILLEIANS